MLHQYATTSPSDILAPTSSVDDSPNTLSQASVTRSDNRLKEVQSGLNSSSHKSNTVQSVSSSRWSLYLQARVWRYLEQIGIWFHRVPYPVPPQTSFIRQFSAHVVGKQEPAISELAFYVAPDYAPQIRQGKKFPVVNLHGGGFTLGTARDDARWTASVLEQTSAIFVSVEYRRAPEYPYPFGVEDGVEALLHLASHADEYGIKPQQIALSGFSAGGDMAFTILLRLRTYTQSIKNEVASKATNDSAPSEPVLPRIVCIVACYPSLDQRLTRAERRAGCSRPDKTLPDILTSLFDQAWLPDRESRVSPFASPAAATDEALQTALPHNIALYLCEWDMLYQEGIDFRDRLTKLGKRVRCTVIAETQHGFDKSPYPFSVDPKVALYYGQACEVLREVFDA